ncbi:hypothetical protein B0T24DRAFT_351258 [Lasiosphaeria ovina]|uniref:Uncharacterized protein n=1 Tax=Lasiosphaeria ovina TaxID=92902 RepID=A0AAE0K340_9PEZI|nr:hypothetical protein B0T24DRAFT_351258 [Lasiosphaeria ovina]
MRMKWNRVSSRQTTMYSTYQGNQNGIIIPFVCLLFSTPNALAIPSPSVPPFLHCHDGSSILLEQLSAIPLPFVLGGLSRIFFYMLWHTAIVLHLTAISRSVDCHLALERQRVRSWGLTLLVVHDFFFLS